jgi:CheY-like chemotaxis protein
VLRFEIQDTGVGITPEVRTKLFQAFAQADTSTTREFGGTGLGLAISKQLVAMMDGRIGVESEPRHGSMFWFTVQLEKQSDAPAGSDAFPAAFAGVRLLVVDDNAAHAAILRDQAAALGFAADTVTDGRKALELLHAAATGREPYRVALVDLHLARVGSATLAAAIKSDPVLATTQLIGLTPIGNVLNADAVLEAHLDGCIAKPVRRARLVDALRSVLDPDAPHEDAGRLAADELPAERGPLPAYAQARILVAEDNAVNRRVALGQLLKLGCTATGVANGREVLEVLEAGAYDIILMDCQMPELDGYETARAIREWERDATRPRAWLVPIHIIAMTAHAMLGDREKCLHAGMNGFVTKPVQLPEIKAALEQWQPAPNAPETATR